MNKHRSGGGCQGTFPIDEVNDILEMIRCTQPKKLIPALDVTRREALDQAKKLNPKLDVTRRETQPHLEKLIPALDVTLREEDSDGGLLRGWDQTEEPQSSSSHSSFRSQRHIRRSLIRTSSKKALPSPRRLLAESPLSKVTNPSQRRSLPGRLRTFDTSGHGRHRRSSLPTLPGNLNSPTFEHGKRRIAPVMPTRTKSSSHHKSLARTSSHKVLPPKLHSDSLVKAITTPRRSLPGRPKSYHGPRKLSQMMDARYRKL